MSKVRLLINLPSGFFRHPELTNVFERLSAFAEVRTGSCNSADEIMPNLKWAEAVIMWSWPKITAEMLDVCPDLKFFGNLDISQSGAKILLNRKLPVSLGRRGFSPAVAEMALTLILASLRRTSNYHSNMWSGSESWVKDFPGDIDPNERELTGRRVGIVGFGGIGQRLSQLLSPFECDIKLYDPFLPEEVVRKFGFPRVSLKELAGHSEILVLCAASNPGTASLIDADFIESMPENAILVNVCRASLVDEVALISRLKRGDLFAALDVFSVEPLPSDSELRSLPNVYLSPHRAGGVIGSVVRILNYVIDDLEAFTNGSERKHALNEKMLDSLDA